MAWIRFDDKRAMHRKFRRQGFAVRGLDEAAICHCGHDETDGFVSDEALEDLAHHHGVALKGTVKLAETLVSMDRWSRVEGGWWIKDYLDFNPSHADLEAARKRDRERKRNRSGTTADSAGNPGGTEAES